ncbi:hypothetical protein KAI46_07635, partial [bacterium]|nr:hypothetical protein [bacterium]
MPTIILNNSSFGRENQVKIEKLKQRAKIYESRGLRLEVNFHLRQIAEKHSGRETILDILNSRVSFIPLEDLKTGEILFLNKSEMVRVELHERELAPEIKIPLEVPVQVKLTNGEILFGNFLIDMPPARSRVSDYLNYSPQYIYLCQKKGDVILNKAYMHSVKNARRASRDKKNITKTPAAAEA